MTTYFVWYGLALGNGVTTEASGFVDTNIPIVDEKSLRAVQDAILADVRAKLPFGVERLIIRNFIRIEKAGL